MLPQHTVVRETLVQSMRRALASVFGILLAVCASVRAQAPAQPNVLFFYVDDLNYDMGTFGHPVVQTPNIDALAATGVRFAEAHCPYPVCGPSRLATLLGQHSHETTLLGNRGYDLDVAEFNGIPALPKFFRQAGWETFGIGKIFHKKQVHADAWDGYYDEWHDTNVAYPPHPDPSQASQLVYGGPYLNGPTGALGRMEDTKFSDEAIVQINTLSQPWFLTVGYVAPHTPFIYPEAYDSLYDPNVDVPPLPPEEQTNWQDEVPFDMYRNDVALDPAWGATEDERRRQALVHYWRTITYIDHEIGRVLAHLDASGQRDDTIIVLLSDHGWSFGTHARYGKIGLYQQSSKAPMIISVPWETGSAGQTCDEPVEHVDLYPTLAEYCNLTAPAGLHGDSLAPQLADPSTPTDPAIALLQRHWETRWLRMVRTRRYKYIYNDNTEPHILFDLQLDPGEYDNVIDDPAYAEKRLWLHQQMVDEGLFEAHWHNYQRGSEGTLGVPALELDARPVMGTAPNLLVENVAGHDTIFLLIAGSYGWRLPIFNGHLLLHPVSTDAYVLPIAGASIPVTIPNTPVFLGESYCLQTAQIDLSLIDTLVFSRGLRMFMLDS